MKKILVAAVFSLISIGIVGCNEKRMNLTGNGTLSAEKHNSKNVKILWADVYKENGQYWAYGVLKRNGNYPSEIKAKVDVQVMSADDSVQYETSSKVLNIGEYEPSKRMYWTRFKIKIDEEIPKGSKINFSIRGCENKI